MIKSVNPKYYNLKKLQKSRETTYYVAGGIGFPVG